MRNSFIASLAIILICFFSGNSAIAAENTPVLHKGVNLSNWLANAERQPLYERDFEQVKQAGFDNVRLPVKPELLVSVTVDKTIKQLLGNGLKVVLDLHPDGAYMKQLENDPDAAERFIALWMDAARYYKLYTADKLVFEALNEPQYYDHEDKYNALMGRLVAAIRRIDGKRTIIIDAPRGGAIDGLEKLAPLQDTGIVYAFHFYEPYMITHQGTKGGFEHTMLRYFHDVPYPSALVAGDARIYADGAADMALAQKELEEYMDEHWNKEHIAQRMQTAKNWADRNHVKILCGEFGAVRNRSDNASRYRWLADVRKSLEGVGIGWQVWDYSDIDGITQLIGRVSADKIDGSVRFVNPETGTRIIENNAIEALGLKKSVVRGGTD